MTAPVALTAVVDDCTCPKCNHEDTKTRRTHEEESAKLSWWPHADCRCDRRGRLRRADCRELAWHPVSRKPERTACPPAIAGSEGYRHRDLSGEVARLSVE